jgi:hypothetical protein
MNRVARLFTSVSKYVGLPIPSALDAEVERVMRAALRGGVSELRALIADAIASGAEPAYPVASGRIQKVAMERHDLDMLTLALETYVAFVVGSWEDPRDLILVLDHLSDDLLRLGADPQHVLRHLVARSLDGQHQQTIDTYLDRERFQPS